MYWEIIAVIMFLSLPAFLLALVTDMFLTKRKQEKLKKLYISPENRKRLEKITKEVNASQKEFKRQRDLILKDIEKETKDRNGKKR